MNVSRTNHRMQAMLAAMAFPFIGALPSTGVASTLIAYWDFNESGNRLGVSEGAGSINLSSNLVFQTNYDFYSGSTVNALPGYPEGQAIVVAAPNKPGLGNGVTWIDFNLDLSGGGLFFLNARRKGAGS